jgi:hypothetical protein
MASVFINPEIIVLIKNAIMCTLEKSLATKIMRYGVKTLGIGSYLCSNVGKEEGFLIGIGTPI